MIKEWIKYMTRYLVALACATLIILRMIWPQLTFDATSLTLLIIVVIVLCIPELDQLVRRVRRIKGGKFEIELEAQVSELAEATERVEKEIEETTSNEYRIQVSDDYRKSVDLYIAEPRGGLIALAIEIESATRELASYYDTLATPGMISPVKTIDTLAKNGLVPLDLPKLLREFWIVRNKAVHSKEFGPSAKQLYELVDLGVRILRLIKSRRVFIDEARKRIKSDSTDDIIAAANVISELGGSETDVELLQEVFQRPDLTEEASETIARAVVQLRRKLNKDESK